MIHIVLIERFPSLIFALLRNVKRDFLKLKFKIWNAKYLLLKGSIKIAEANLFTFNTMKLFNKILEKTNRFSFS